MAKKVILRSKGGTLYYPQTVSQAVYDNETGKTLKEVTDALSSGVSTLEESVNGLAVKLMVPSCSMTVKNGSSNVASGTVKYYGDTSLNNVSVYWSAKVDNVDVEVADMSTFSVVFDGATKTTTYSKNGSVSIGAVTKPMPTGDTGKTAVSASVTFKTKLGLTKSASWSMTFVAPQYCGYVDPQYVSGGLTEAIIKAGFDANGSNGKVAADADHKGSRTITIPSGSNKRAFVAVPVGIIGSGAFNAAIGAVTSTVQKYNSKVAIDGVNYYIYFVGGDTNGVTTTYTIS